MAGCNTPEIAKLVHNAAIATGVSEVEARELTATLAVAMAVQQAMGLGWSAAEVGSAALVASHSVLKEMGKSVSGVEASSIACAAVAQKAVEDGADKETVACLVFEAAQGFQLLTSQAGTQASQAVGLSNAEAAEVTALQTVAAVIQQAVEGGRGAEEVGTLAVVAAEAAQCLTGKAPPVLQVTSLACMAVAQNAAHAGQGPEVMARLAREVAHGCGLPTDHADRVALMATRDIMRRSVQDVARRACKEGCSAPIVTQSVQTAARAWGLAGEEEAELVAQHTVAAAVHHALTTGLAPVDVGAAALAAGMAVQQATGKLFPVLETSSVACETVLREAISTGAEPEAVAGLAVEVMPGCSLPSPRVAHMPLMTASGAVAAMACQEGYSLSQVARQAQAAATAGGRAVV